MKISFSVFREDAILHGIDDYGEQSVSMPVCEFPEEARRMLAHPCTKDPVFLRFDIRLDPLRVAGFVPSMPVLSHDQETCRRLVVDLMEYYRQHPLPGSATAAIEKDEDADTVFGDFQPTNRDAPISFSPPEYPVAGSKAMRLDAPPKNPHRRTQD